MGGSFTHKFLMTVFAAFAAAGLLFVYRHVVVKAIHETSTEGWLEMDQQRAKEKAAQHH